MAVPPPPQIEGCLKDAINSLGFGLIVAVFIVNVGITWIPNFFPWMIGTLVVLQLVLFLPEKAKPDYEKYVEGSRKGRHVIQTDTGQMVLDDEGQCTPHKTRTGRIRDKFRKKGPKGSSGDIFLEVPKESRFLRRRSTGSVNALEVPVKQKPIDKAKEDGSKEEKTENKEKGIEKESEKEKEKSVDQGSEKEKEEDKEKGGWRKRLHIGKPLSRRESMTKADSVSRDKTI